MGTRIFLKDYISNDRILKLLASRFLQKNNKHLGVLYGIHTTQSERYSTSNPVYNYFGECKENPGEENSNIKGASSNQQNKSEQLFINHPEQKESKSLWFISSDPLKHSGQELSCTNHLEEANLGKWFIDTQPIKKESSKLGPSARHLQMRVKGFVKQHYTAGKFHDILEKVIATPQLLEIAYQSLMLSSGVSQTNEVPFSNDNHEICLNTLSTLLADEEFQVEPNTLKFLSSRRTYECLVLPNLKLKVIQEATRMVLEAIYRSQFSKISHSCRNGRGQHTALNYIARQIHDPDWWFVFATKKKLDKPIFDKLVASMKEHIDDEKFFKLLEQMYDANVLNVEFGSFPKNQGYIQEGILSTILINIYLNLFDQEFYKICLQHEALDSSDCVGQPGLPNQEQHGSKLRRWILNQAKRKSETKHSDVDSPKKIHACRYVDEIFIAISGTREFAMKVQDKMQTFLESSLHLKFDHRQARMRSSVSEDVQFLGMYLRKVALSDLQTSGKKTSVRVVSKLTDKLGGFSQEKQRRWEALCARLGKRWLAHALKKIKKSEKDMGGMICEIAKFRKPGMVPEHWFKELLITWIQDLDRQFETDERKRSWLRKASEKDALSKLIIQPELPEDLKNAFFRFQDKVDNLITSEAAMMESYKRSLETTDEALVPESSEMKILMEAPIFSIRRCLFHSRIITRKREPRCLHALVHQDDMLIISWYIGVALRWIDYFSGCRNFYQIKRTICEDLKQSCLRTLAKKHKASLAEVLKHFGEKLMVLRYPSRPGIVSSTCLPVDQASFRPSMWLLQAHREASSYSKCSVDCCNSRYTRLYSLFRSRKWQTLNVKRRVASVGFGNLHPSFGKKHIALCQKHVEDLYLGRITLRNFDFGVLLNSREP